MDWVLIIVLHAYRGGIGVVQQPFGTAAACEAAREHIVKSIADRQTIVIAQGCHPLAGRSAVKPLT